MAEMPFACAQITLTDLTDTATYIYYATDANGSSPSLGPSATSKYIGIYNDESLDNQPAPGTAAYNSIKDKINWSEYVGSITVVSIQYQEGVSGTTAPTGSWSNEVVSVGQGKYLWTKTAYSDGTESFTVSRQATDGTDGEDGDDGRGILSITNYYVTSTSNTDPPADNAGWSTDLAQTDESNKFLWNYEKITYTDGTSESLDKRIISTHGETGAAGADGRGIKSIADTYARTTEYDPPSSTATNTWLQTAPELTGDYKYLWCKEVITYTSGNPLTETTIRLLAQRGEQGAQGENGKDLIREGIWVEEIARYYVATITLGVNDFPKYSTDNGTDFSAWKERNASNLGWTGNPSSNQAKILFEVLGTKTTNYSNGVANSSTIVWGTAKSIDVKAAGATRNSQAYLNYLIDSNGGKKCGVYHNETEGTYYLNANYIQTGALQVIDNGTLLFSAGYDSNGYATVKMMNWVVDDTGLHDYTNRVGIGLVNADSSSIHSDLKKWSSLSNADRAMVFYAYGREQTCNGDRYDTKKYPNFCVLDDGSLFAKYGEIASWGLKKDGLYAKEPITVTKSVNCNVQRRGTCTKSGTTLTVGNVQSGQKITIATLPTNTINKLRISTDDYCDVYFCTKKSSSNQYNIVKEYDIDSDREITITFDNVLKGATHVIIQTLNSSGTGTGFQMGTIEYTFINQFGFIYNTNFTMKSLFSSGSIPVIFTTDVSSPDGAGLSIGLDGSLRAKWASLEGSIVINKLNSSTNENSSLATHCLIGDNNEFLWTNYNGSQKLDGAKGIQLRIQGLNATPQVIFSEMQYDASQELWISTGKKYSFTLV